MESMMDIFNSLTEEQQLQILLNYSSGHQPTSPVEPLPFVSGGYQPTTPEDFITGNTNGYIPNSFLPADYLTSGYFANNYLPTESTNFLPNSYMSIQTSSYASTSLNEYVSPNPDSNYLPSLQLFSQYSDPTSPIREEFLPQPTPNRPRQTLGYPSVVGNSPYRPRVKPTILTSGSHLNCATCKQPFERGSSLRRHEKLHTGEKPYACPHCNKAFTRLDILRRHQSSARCRLNAQRFLTNI